MTNEKKLRERVAKETEDLLGELLNSILTVLDDSELVAEFDDRVTINFDREAFEEMVRLLFEYDSQIIKQLGGIH